MFDIWSSLASIQQACLYRPLSDRMLDQSGCVRKEILNSVDRLFCEHLAAGRASFQAPPSPPPMSAEHRFLNVSALQKSIRRGDVEGAVRFAQQGCEVDAEHVFRRLAVCAVEDVGIGNLLAVGMALAVAGNKGMRQNGAPDELAAYLAYLLAVSPKSRLACDLLSVCDYNRSLKWLKNDLARAADDDLRRRAEARRQPIGERMAAAWMLAGTARFRGTTMPKVARPRTAVMQMMAAIRMPLMFYYIADRTGARLSDALFISTFLMWEMIKAEPDMTVLKQPLSDVAMIAGFPAAAYDLHTYEGRAAINRFSRECPALNEQLRSVPPGQRDMAARHAVFIAEGGRLSEQVRFDAADTVEREAHAAELAFAGIRSSDHRRDLLNSVVQCLPHLDVLRASMVQHPPHGCQPHVSAGCATATLYPRSL